MRYQIEQRPEESDEALRIELARYTRAHMATLSDPENQARVVRLNEYCTLRTYAVQHKSGVIPARIHVQLCKS